MLNAERHVVLFPQSLKIFHLLKVHDRTLYTAFFQQNYHWSCGGKCGIDTAAVAATESNQK